MIFDNIKKIAELKKLQDGFKKEKITIEKRGISVVMNGNFEVEEIKLNSELSLEDQQETLKQCLNEARENIQKTLAKVMMSSGIGF
jgi:DNA-binding protein YbaB